MKSGKILIVGCLCLLVAGLSGCGDPEGTQRSLTVSRHHCTPNTAQQRADFILRCVEGANPKSDEEPEDWIRHCQYMAEQTLCDKQTLSLVERCANGDPLFGSCHRWEEVTRKPIGN